MDGFSPDFFLYWDLILSHLCTGYHGRRLRIPLNMSITLFLDMNVPCCLFLSSSPHIPRHKSQRTCVQEDHFPVTGFIVSAQSRFQHNI